MSRITGNDALGLYEAYQSVYAPQEELTEEQVWEEVEAWATSLVEEGYDLSEYTWEDMYEAYIEEQGRGRVTGSNPNVWKPTPSTYRPGGGRQEYNQRRSGTGQMPPPASPKPQIGGLPANYRGQELQQAAKARASQVGTTRQGTAGGPTVGGNTPIGSSAKPAAAKPAAAKPAPTAAAKPAAAKPAPSAANPAPTAPTAPAAPKKTFNPLMQKTFGYQTGYAPDQIKNNPKKLAQMGSLKSISDSFDMFDVVKEYLLGEGYADTEEAAVAIMANMSEDWKYHIIDEARAEGVKPYRGTATQADVRKNEKEAREKHVKKAKEQKGYGEDEKFSNWKDKATPSSTLTRKGGETETVSQRMDREKPYGKRMTGPLARKQGSRIASAVTRTIEGPGEPQAVTMPRMGRGEKAKSSKEIIRKG